MVAKRVLALLGDILSMDEEDVHRTMPLIGGGGIESLDLAKLVIECERAFQVTIDDEDVHRFYTLNELISYIEGKLD